MTAVATTAIPIIFMIFWLLIPIVLVVLILRWIWIIKKNSEEHSLQNRQIVDLLREIKDKINTER